MSSESKLSAVQNVRVVTAAALFDGHDAAINVMRRLIQAEGCEVIHLAHNRSVVEVVDAAVQEDAHAVAVTSYQGGHVDYFLYLRRLLDERGASHVRIFGGGGGVIVPEEADQLHEKGITRIYHPEDGRRMGLVGMIKDLVSKCDQDLLSGGVPDFDGLLAADPATVARYITAIEADVDGAGVVSDTTKEAIADAAAANNAPVVGITGTGGAGKSSLTDELVRRFRSDFPNLKRWHDSIEARPAAQRGWAALD